MGVERPLELSIDGDDVDIENIAVAVKHVAEMKRDLVHDPEHPPARRLRNRDLCRVKNPEYVKREALVNECGGDRADEKRADRVKAGLTNIRSRTPRTQWLHE